LAVYRPDVSSTTENYLKTIFVASQVSPEELVSLGEIAQSLNVTPGTVTTMMKSLAAAGLVVYRPRSGVLLTDEGKDVALSVVRRHRLLELFLVEVLGLDWTEVHDEAEELEHAISDRLIERIDEVLGHPKRDPHGDPIPDAAGTFTRTKDFPLADAANDGAYTIVRVEGDEPEFLGYLKETGLVPGAAIENVKRNDPAGTLAVDTPQGGTVISVPIARKLHVRPNAPPE
jgi:DtxR family Mn-dependent transcriptional regulator